MSIEYGLPASLTGPCLVTVCGMSTIVGTSICGSTVNLCEAGSSSYTNPADASSESQQCSYVFTDDSTGGTASCEVQALSGEIKGSGDSWSLFDSSSTINLDRIVATQSAVTVGTILFVSTTSVLSHFLTEGAAEASTMAVSPPSTTLALGTASGLTSIRGTNGASTTASPRTSTSSSRPASATPPSSQSGQNRLHASRIKVLSVVGGVMLALASL